MKSNLGSIIILLKKMEWSKLMPMGIIKHGNFKLIMGCVDIGKYWTRPVMASVLKSSLSLVRLANYGRIV